MDVQIEATLSPNHESVKLRIKSTSQSKGRTHNTERTSTIISPFKKRMRVAFAMEIETWLNRFPMGFRLGVPVSKMEKYISEGWNLFIQDFKPVNLTFPIVPYENCGDISVIISQGEV